jgi:hypothetical protein
MKMKEQFKKVKWLYCVFYAALGSAVVLYGGAFLISWLRSRGIYL